MRIQFRLNGKAVQREVKADLLLVDLLRELGCYSVKRGCETANCGLCTVWMDEKPILSCSTLAVRADGRHVKTLEGLQKEAEEFGRLLAAEGGEQCGFCSPGLIMNVLAMDALIGAYCPEGQAWVDELCQVLSANVNFACDYIRSHFDGVRVAQPEGTYMLFVDCADWCRAHGRTIDEVEKAAWAVGVAIQDGRMFHGPCAVRMNLAHPFSRVEEAFRRLDKYVFNA